MENDAKILVALATYNELENLPSLVEAIHRVLPLGTILVIDDNSPDGTPQWCKDFESKNPWFRFHHRPGKLGLGTALAKAMEISCQDDYDYLITIDADWSHPPEALPQMVEATANADVIVGSRYCRGGAIEGWPWKRRFISRVINLATRILLGTPVNDCSSNYRLYRTTLLKQLALETLRSDGYAFIEEVLWHLHRDGARLAEVPIVFTDRVAGESKINLGEAWGAVKTLLRLTWQRFTRNPFHRVQK